MKEKKQPEVIGPKSRKQQMFLESDADVCIFGGAAGSSKSYSGIMGFIPHIKYKNFRGLITRRTTPQLKGSGGILDTAMQMFQKIDPKVRYKAQENKFVFTSGAEISLRHFEHSKNKSDYQGLQTNHILVDEGAQFEEDMVTYLMSRLRNPSCAEVKPRIRITTNPDKNSFLRRWLDWWIDADGYPIEERCGVKRWFVNLNGVLHFADTAEELVEQFSTPTFQAIPMSMCFINATIFDNPTLMEAQPGYLAFLQGLPRVEKARLLEGNWEVTEESAGYWKREWCEIVDMPPLSVVRRCRAWDIAGTLPSDLNPRPDWTAGVLMSKDKYGNYYIEDLVHFQARHGEVFQRMVETAKMDGDDVLISVPQDPSAAGKQYAMTMVRDLAEHGFYAKCKSTNKSKITRFAPFCAASETKSIKVVRGEWNEKFFQELEQFDGSRRNHDDMVDACSDAFIMLASTISIPSFVPPEMGKSNQFNF